MAMMVRALLEGYWLHTFSGPTENHLSRRARKGPALAERGKVRG